MKHFYTKNGLDLKKSIINGYTHLFSSFKDAEIFAKEHNSLMFPIYDENERFVSFGVNTKKKDLK